MKKILLFHLDYLRFIIYPTFEKDLDSSIIRKTLRIIWVFIFSTIFSYLIFSLLYWFPFKSFPIIHSTSSIFYAIILGPILEELMFRSILRFDEFSFQLFISSWITFYIVPYLYFNLQSPYKYIPAVIFLIIVFVGLTIIFKKYPKVILVLNKYHRKFRYLIYFILIISFGLVHLMNFESLYGVGSGIIIYTLHKTFIGITNAYLRIRYGLLFSIIAHMLYNALPRIFHHLNFYI